jgi:Predicted membrane protein
MLHVLRKPLLFFRRYYHALWLRVTLYALLSLAVSLITLILRRYMPEELAQRIDTAAVMPVLTILASSMLAVSTFTLNVMVSAHTSAANTATPRIHRLLLQDTTTQSVLSAFIGAFIFALSSIILFRTHLYGDDEAVVVMALTILFVVVIIIAMLRWIEHLSQLGSLDNSLDLAEQEAWRSLTALRKEPALGANLLTPETILPEKTIPLRATKTGYIQFIDTSALNACAGGHGLIYVLHRPGRFVLEGTVLAQLSGFDAEADMNDIARAFVIGPIRTHEVDAEFSLTTLSEISSKALSPGVNDPGTAVDAVTRMTAIFWQAAHIPATETSRAPRVFCPPPSAQALIDAAFAATARDGAALIEVSSTLRRSLLALTEAPDEAIAAAAKDMAARALDYARKALPLESEKDQLENLPALGRSYLAQSFSTTTEPTE